MKRLLTYRLMLMLTLLAGLFVVPACQDDLPDSTEVMMTFTTRAVVSDVENSNAPDEDKMKDLRVIMLRENGTVVDNHLEKGINASSVTFTFTTPIQTGGEDFTFLAVANEESIQTKSALSWLSCSPGDKLSDEAIAEIKSQQIGDGEAFNINDGSIPQTKQWTVTVPQTNYHVENQQLDFVASKISVQFINNTNAEQSLSDIHITGIGRNVYGYLFAQNGADFIGENHNASDITFNAVSNLAVSATSDAQAYYTYPIASLSSPTLHATWNGKEYTLPLEGITSLKRNDHLQIVVTLTGHALTINYSIAPWVEEATNIGSPTTEGGYQVGGWGEGNDIIIGGEIGGGEEPDGGESGEVIVWEGSQSINWSNNGYELLVYTSWLNGAAIIEGPNDLDGIQMYVYFTSDGSGVMQIREASADSQYGSIYLDGNSDGYTSLGNNSKISVFIPESVKNTPFRFSGQYYTITKVTVIK